MYQLFKSAAQPLCRCCAKPIGKHTILVWVHEKPTAYHRHSTWCRYVYGDLRNKADCQRHTNQQVLSISYTEDTKDGEPIPGTRRVRRFNEWDGETYTHPFFCSGSCAQAFGLLAAQHTKLMTQAYADAISTRRIVGETV